MELLHGLNQERAGGQRARIRQALLDLAFKQTCFALQRHVEAPAESGFDLLPHHAIDRDARHQG